MNAVIRPRLIYAFSRRYPALPHYLIEDRVADALTDMQLNPPPEEVRAIPEKYYQWACTVINRALSYESKRLQNIVKISDEIEAADNIAAYIDQDAIEKCLKELPSNEREVVVMRMYANYTFEKIAIIIGKSPSMIKKSFYAAMERLKDMIIPPPSGNNHANRE